MNSRRVAINPDDSPRDRVRPILRAAREIFMKHGYGEASMDSVARDAGVSKATLYVYFPSKRDLFAAIILEERDRYAQPTPAGKASRSAPRATLIHLGQAIVDFLLAPDTVASMRMVVAEASRFPELGQEFHANGPAKLRGHVAAHLLEMMKDRALRRSDPEAAAETFIDLVRGDLQLRALLGVTDQLSRRQVESVVRRGVDAFLKIHAASAVKLRAVMGAAS